MSLRDGGYDYEDGCPECGAGVWEGEDGAICKADCGWTTVAPRRRFTLDPALVRKYQAEIDALHGKKVARG